MKASSWHRWHVFLFAVACAVLVGSPGEGAADDEAGEEGPRRTFFVSPHGDDGQSGTQQAPWRTIRRATEAWKAGDTVYLRAGVYPESVRLRVRGAAATPTTLAAWKDERPVIDGKGVESAENGIVVVASHLRIAGLVIRNWRGNAIWVEQSDHVEVEGCHVHDVTYGVGFADGSHHFRCKRVEARDFDLYGFDVSPSGGVACHHGTFVQCRADTGRDRDQNVDGFALGHGEQHDFVLDRCVTRNVYDGIDVSARATTVTACVAHHCWNSGFKLWQDDVRLVNCVGYDCDNAIVELDWDEQPGTVTLWNCTFWGGKTYTVWVENSRDRLRMFNCLLGGGGRNGLTFEQRDAKNYEGDHNLFHNANPDRAIVVGYEDEFSLASVADGAWRKHSGQDAHSVVVLEAAGLFRNLEARDLRPAPKSPAIDRGRQAGAPTHDRDGHPRPSGKGTDIGAHEHP